MITYFDPQPHEVPDRMPSPFAIEPHSLARRAAELLQAELHEGIDAGGKMFGVLVVAAPDGIGFLRAYSGMLDGRWDVAGFAPPVFDSAARDAFWPAGERYLAEIDRRLADLSATSAPLRAALAELTARHASATAVLAERHRANRVRRHEARRSTDPIARHALDQESRGDTAERRRHDATDRAALDATAATVQSLDGQRVALEELRAERSRHYLHAIHSTYVLANARGERRLLRELFAPNEPPGGAGDCAAPKLLAFAYRNELRPIALAEFWWGPPPATGGRHHGAYYPACRGKCGPILAHVLAGLDVEAPPVFGVAPIAADEPRTVFEDRWLVVVSKPEGLLSVPGRSGALRDSVITRLRARFAEPLVVHRLDLDTSGLVLVAKDAATHAALQRQFARREISKRYIAWLDGEVAGESGVVELALRVDLDDRPRQIHDPIHGKTAITEWSVIARTGGRTRVAMIPRTGRTHQLRVHAAHARGIGVPIVGDRLYGKSDARMMLHAEALGFVHPHTGERIELELLAPF